MATVRYSDAEGWHDARIEPRAPIPMDPAAAVLHYAQEIFEGLKAYRTAGGGATLFRPDENARRFQQSAERLAMPILPEKVFLDAVDQLVKIDRAWIPDGDGSLYIRPFMFANEIFLGVKPSSDYLFIVIASSVGAYFKTDAPAVSVWVSDDYTRAAPGGTGAAKCGGNYAASLQAQAEATRHGCDQVVFLDAVETALGGGAGRHEHLLRVRRRLDGHPAARRHHPARHHPLLADPARQGQGHHRARGALLDPAMAKDAASGRLREAFACGTAAVVTPIGTVRAPDGEFTIGNGGSGARTEELKASLVNIQRCRAADPYGWIHKVF